MKKILLTVTMLQVMIFFVFTGFVLAGEKDGDMFILQKYNIKKSDCLIKIAKEFKVNSFKTIAGINGLKSPYTIYLGRSLLVPVRTNVAQIAQQQVKVSLSELNGKILKSEKEISRLKKQADGFRNLQTLLTAWIIVLTVLMLVIIGRQYRKMKVDREKAKRSNSIKTLKQGEPRYNEAQVKFSVNDVNYTCTLAKEDNGIATFNLNNQESLIWVSSVADARRSVKSSLKRYLKLGLSGEKAIMLKKAIYEQKLTRDLD